MRLLLAATVLVLLAGCFRLDPSVDGNKHPEVVSATSIAPTPAPTSATPPCGQSSDNPCCPPGWHYVSYGCAEPLAAHLIVETAAAVDVGVPFPHLDRCLSPQAWMTADQQTTSAETTMRNATLDRGELLAVHATRQTHAELVLNLTGHPICQTFRYDPWSTEPDPKDGTLDVHADHAVGLTVTVRTSDGNGCWTTTTYRGTTANGWATLQADDDPRTLCV